MHYMNGREAHNGDKVVLIPPYSKKPVTGILYDAKAGNDYCNGMFAPLGGGPHVCPNLKECVHLDDFLAGQPETYPDLSQVAAAETES